MQKPQLTTYLKIYHGILAVIHFLGLIIFGLLILVIALNSDFSTTNANTQAATRLIMFIIFAVLFVVEIFAIGLQIWAYIYSDRRTKFAYYFQFVLCALGCLSIITIIPCVYFIIQLMKPEIKDYYKVTATQV